MKYLYEETDRINMIKNFLENKPEPISIGKILDIENDKPENYDVYEMPMYFFVHNSNNGRHFIETQEKIINLKLEEGKLDPIRDNNLIEEMLYESKLERNNITKDNLEKFSQQEPIIATNKGIIIDGNRRFMLLKRIWREKKLDLAQQKIKVIILKNNYTSSQLNSLETKIQFRKESKVDYDPINKKIKIFNMYEEMLRNKGIQNRIEKFKNNINNEILKEISSNTGESETKIKEYLKIISFVKWFLNSKDANNFLSLFLNKDEQLKNLYKIVKAFNESREKFPESKMWFDKDKSVEDKFIDASMYQILHKVKAVGSFRDIMGSKTNWGILKYEDLFNEWYERTINIVGNNIKEFILTSEKREELEELNRKILWEIDNKKIEERKLLDESNKENFAEMQVQTAINFFGRRLIYFDSVEVISEESKQELEKINEVINKILAKN